MVPAGVHYWFSLALVACLLGCDSQQTIDEEAIQLHISLDKNQYAYDETPVVTIHNNSSSTVFLNVCSGEIQQMGSGFWVTSAEFACTLVSNQKEIPIEGGTNLSKSYFVGSGGTFRLLLDIRDEEGDLLPEPVRLSPPIVVEADPW